MGRGARVDRSSMRWARTGLAAGLAMLAAPACGTHVGLSNGSVSACFRALPAAEAAVHERSAHLVGVHRVPVDRVEAQLPPAMRSPIDLDTTVCAVVLRGHFSAGQVDLAPAGAAGGYAIVLIDSSHLRLLAAFVLDHIPVGLGRRLM